MMKTIIALCVTCMLLPLAACHRADDPIVIRIFYHGFDPRADQMRAAIDEMERPKELNGKPILVAEYAQTREQYEQCLATGCMKDKAQVIVFESATERRVSLVTEMRLSASAGEWVAGVPEWVSGEERVAAELVLKQLAVAFGKIR